MPQQTISLLFGILLATAAAAQTDATIYLHGNRVIQATVTNISSSSLNYQLPRSKANSTLTFDQIETIIWPESEVWKKALTHLERQEFDEATQLFEQLVIAPQRFTYHPAPGNFSTRARRKLLDIYRFKMNGELLSSHFEKVTNELALLPPNERKISPAVNGWIAASAKNWNAIDKLAAQYPFDTEISYLAGLALLEKNDPVAADFAFTKAYTLDAAGNRIIAREALRESILIQPNSVKVHTYASLFGKGKLWENAPENTVALLIEELTPTTPILGEEEGSGDLEKYDTPQENAKRFEKVN